MQYKNHLLLRDDEGKRYRACRHDYPTDLCIPISEFLARPGDLRCKHCERVLRTQEDQSAYTLAEAMEGAQRTAMERNISVYVYRYQYQRLSKKFDGYLTSTNPYRARGWEDGLHECCIELVEVVAPSPSPASHQ